VTRQAKHRQKRRAQGLCGTEGCRNESGTYYCEPCRLHRNASWKKWYATNRDKLKNARCVADMIKAGDATD
jgi:hypothetical protein